MVYSKTQLRSYSAFLPLILSVDDNKALEAVSKASANNGVAWIGLKCTSDTSCVWDDGSAFDATKSYNNFKTGSKRFRLDIFASW